MHFCTLVCCCTWYPLQPKLFAHRSSWSRQPTGERLWHRCYCETPQVSSHGYTYTYTCTCILHGASVYMYVWIQLLWTYVYMYVWASCVLRYHQHVILSPQTSARGWMWAVSSGHCIPAELSRRRAWIHQCHIGRRTKASTNSERYTYIHVHWNKNMVCFG